jgi:hypothetical protein
MRRTRGRFPGLNIKKSGSPGTISPIDSKMDTADPEDIAVRAWEINQVLADANCNCVGHAKGLVESPDSPGHHHRDEYFAADLQELAARSLPHIIQTIDGPKEVSIDLSSLSCDVDEYGEVCAWIYEES